MHRRGHEHTLVIDIPPGLHSYKYIVDDEWRINLDAPSATDAQGVINNTVVVQRTVFDDTPDDLSDSEEEDDNKQRVGYGTVIPSQDEYIKDPPKVPPHLAHILLNNSVVTEPTVLPLPQHVTIDHLYMYGSSRREIDDVIVTGITQRFKTKQHSGMGPKYVTTVYYSPKPML
jgi:5'-AMP-activated protein kinase regulatory beta subunit